MFARHCLTITMLASCWSLVHAADSKDSKETKVIIVPDGLAPRDNSVVIANLPNTDESLALVDKDGQLYPIARCGDGQGRAFLPDLNNETTFTIQKVPAAAPTITIAMNGEMTQFKIGDREIIAYQGGKGNLPDGYDENYRRGGYLARLSTPTGLLVTDDYPVKHKHHHSLWHAWTRTKYDGREPDFWNMGNGKAGIQNIDHTPAWSAGAWAGITYRNRYEDKNVTPAVDVLEERIAMVARAPLPDDPVVIIDITVVHACLTPQPLYLPTYHYGGLGVRGHAAWDGTENATFLTSTGKDRAAGNFTRATWVHMGGLVDGKQAGLAVLCHPENFRAPQPIRLHPSEPFICFAPSQLGDWAINPGISYIARYRLIIADGKPDADDLEQRWQEYAHPLLVTWDGKLVR